MACFFCIFHALSFELNFVFDRRCPLTILCVKTLREFDKGYRGLKFISNFIIIFVSWSQDYRQFHYNYCHRKENFN